MSFNRNMKRIAGPGFHVNVRYDDYQVSKQKNNGKAAAILQKGMRLPELFDVKEQELLVAMDSSRQANYFDGYTHCFSCANGMTGTDGLSADNPDELKEAILNQVKFVGVATTEFVPKAGYMEQGFVAQVGGVTTILNESNENIYPGDKVMLDVNVNYARKVTREKGIPREKVRFTIKRANTADEMLDAAMAAVGASANATPTSAQSQAIADAQAKVNTANAELTAAGADKNKKKVAQGKLKAAKKELAKATAAVSVQGGKASIVAILDKLRDMNERVIGKAYSFARPGDRLEIGLQPRSEY